MAIRNVNEMGMCYMLRKLFMVLSLTVLFLANISVVNAANWQWVRSNNKVTMTMDMNSISKNNDIYTVWVQLKYVYLNKYVNNKRIDHTTEEWKYLKGSSGYMVSVARVLAYGEGELLYDRTYNTDPKDVVPGSFGETILNKILQQHTVKDMSGVY